MAEKSEQAFRTIGELAGELGVPQHILRYWETRFPQLKPMQRAGNRRYYRPGDVALARRIHHLLTHEGYTIRGVQKVLSGKGGEAPSAQPQPFAAAAPPAVQGRPNGSADADLRGLRSLLADALAQSRV
jgi:DNA-binding transcriptional MerR regulator